MAIAGHKGRNCRHGLRMRVHMARMMRASAGVRRGGEGVRFLKGAT